MTLLPDLSATTEIDPVREVYRLGVELETCTAEDLAAYDASDCERIAFRLGYIKPPRLLELRCAMARLSKSDAGPEDKTIEFSKVYRDILRAALRGWSLPEPFPTDTEELIEQIEIKGWLHALAWAALAFNTLDEAAKKK